MNEALNRKLKTSEVAEILGITVRALRMRFNRGSISGKRIGLGVKSKLSFTMSDVVEAIDNGLQDDPLDRTKPGSQLDRLVTRLQAAQMMNMSPATLWDRNSRGLGPMPVTRIANKTMYRIGDVVDTIDNVLNDREFAVRRARGFYKRKADSSRYRIAYEDALCKCPFCEKRFTQRIVKGGCKYLFCPEHQDIRDKATENTMTNYDMNYVY
jgi:hypothetical protein